jgi:hypothetical protein
MYVKELKTFVFEISFDLKIYLFIFDHVWSKLHVINLGVRQNSYRILCTHVYKWKNETFWNYFRNGGKRDKGE